MNNNFLILGQEGGTSRLSDAKVKKTRVGVYHFIKKIQIVCYFYMKVSKYFTLMLNRAKKTGVLFGIGSRLGVATG